MCCGLICEGHPKIWWVWPQRVTKKFRRCNTGNGIWIPIDGERCAYDGRIGTIALLPSLVAHHGDRWRAGHVVCRREQPPGIRTKSEKGEIVAGYELCDERFGNAAVATTDAHLPEAGLEGRLGGLLRYY